MELLRILADNMGMGEGVIFTIICLLIVFAVIAAIIFGIYFISNLMDKSEEKKNGPKSETKSPAPVVKQIRNTNITDEDMMAAVLVATIDYRNEIKEDVRLVNVREVK